MTAIHELKTWPEHFRAVVSGEKRFELRVADRDFNVGDVLVLQEWEPEGHFYTREAISVRVTYILRGPAFGLPAGICVMSIDTLPPPPHEEVSR